jgi:hypothetical protein
MVHYLIPVDFKETKFTRIITKNEEQAMAYINSKYSHILSCNTNPYTTTVTNIDYNATEEDRYIGVVSEMPVMITLPEAMDGKVFIVKNELGSSSGKIVVSGVSGVMIDRAEVFEMNGPFESATFVSRGGNWYVV